MIREMVMSKKAGEVVTAASALEVRSMSRRLVNRKSRRDNDSFWNLRGQDHQGRLPVEHRFKLLLP